jgi:UDP-GlcNAc:undecaprenyl-phosphate/decaprenyl-phosphate GlcNAc-1-phosphate transferase
VKILELISFGFAGLIISLVCNTLLLRFSHSLGIRNKNDVTIRWSSESKPSLGGISFFVVFIFISIGFSIVYSGSDIFNNKQYVGLLAAGSLAFAMGLSDDAYDTKPKIKLLCQITCGLLLAYTGTCIELFHLPILDVCLTVLFVIAVMNSLNMLDNMDGITGTVSLSIIIACLISDFMLFGSMNKNIWSISMIAQIGGIIGFLFYNIHPSKIFMGDAGSQFISLFVAAVSIKNLWNVGETSQLPSWIGIVIVAVVFVASFSDTITVIINRLKKGQSPMVGGKDHTTHHLVYSGKKDIQVWYIFAFISSLSLFVLSILLYFSLIHFVAGILIGIPFFLTVFILLYRITKKYPEPKKKNKA